jgi:3D (Asp-Asp-Asp) domain-containing protein
VSVIATMIVTASAYCCFGLGGGYCHRTAYGYQVGPGQIAADPRVLPAHSRVVVELYGPAIVTDTGNDIRGNRIDVFHWACSDAWNWGIRTVAVSLLGVESPQPVEVAEVGD